MHRRSMHLRLAILMFLQYAGPGMWVPIFSLHLQDLQFAPRDAAWANTTAAIGAILAPWMGQVADRWLSTERCLLLCASACSVLLGVLSVTSDPTWVFLLCLGNWIFAVPIFSLGASLTFRHLQDPEREFGRIRLWGTLGWAAMGWLLWGWFEMRVWIHGGNADLRESLAGASIVNFLLALYTLTLPRTPPNPKPREAATGLSHYFDAPIQALKLFKQRSLAVYFFCVLGVYITLPFWGQMGSLFLHHLGVPRRRVPLYMTINQLPEILSLAVLPMLLLRFEFKGTLLIGLLCWLANLTICSIGEPAWLALSSNALYGVFICCFLIAGQVYVNGHAKREFRASAQSLIQFINGWGMLAGHLLVGWMRVATNEDFPTLFGTAAAITVGLVCIFLVGFTGKPASSASPSGITPLVDRDGMT